MARCATSSACAHRASHGVADAPDPASRFARAAITDEGSAATTRSAVRSGSIHAPRRCTTTSRAPEPPATARGPWTRVARRDAARLRDGGRPRIGDGATSSRTLRRSCGPARRAPERGSASTGHPSRSASACTPGPPAPRPATITPRTASSASVSTSTAASSSALSRSGGRRRPCATSDPPACRPAAAPARRRAGRGTAGSRARARVRGLPRRAPRPPRARRATATRLGSLPTAPPRRRTSAPIRRRGAADRSSAARRRLAARGAIGSRRDERDRALVRLDDRGMQLDGRGAAARQHDCGSSGGEPDPERHERAAALVVVHVHGDASVGRRARPRAESTSIRDTRPRR